MTVEFKPKSPTGGSSAFYNGGDLNERTPYRVEKDRLILPERSVTYVFRVDKESLWLGLPGEKAIKTYRRVRPAPTKAKK